MTALGGMLAFVLGAIVGSFLNVVSLRYNSGLTLGGRSMCMSCGKPLRWYELVPVLSFAFQRGRCTSCKSRISMQYPLVELATAALFLMIYAAAEGGGPAWPALAALHALIWSVLVVIFVYDMKHKIIPESLVWAFAVLSAGHIGLRYWEGTLLGSELLGAILSGPIMFAPFLALWLASQGRWIGFGDAKLALGIGWLLGLSRAVSAILLGVWAGAVFSLLIMGASRLRTSATGETSKLLGLFPANVSAKTEIPFAPFLILGIFLVFFFELSVIAF